MEIREYVEGVCRGAKAASSAIAAADTALKNKVIVTFARLLKERSQYIMLENNLDVVRAKDRRLGDAMCDRLTLTEERLDGIIAALLKLTELPDPVGGGTVSRRPNGLEIKKVSVPLGTVGVIFEARPNVSADIAGLCLKSGNAAVLRGGKEAFRSNRAIVECAQLALKECGLPPEVISFIESTEREGAECLMEMRGLIDVLIPRGGRGLIMRVVEYSKVPVIETGAGNCHIYVHSDADMEKAVSIVANAKLSRPSVCNAVETVLVHRAAARRFLPEMKEALGNTEIRGCDEVRHIIPCRAAMDIDWDSEYNDYMLAVKVVDSLEEAVLHINRHSTGHSEAIITESRSAADYFTRAIDSACVYVNASTRFTDGGEFGLGAEVGISTQKLHARGPMGLEALTTTKYIINGDGQIR